VSGGFPKAATPQLPQSGVSVVRASGRVQGVTASSTTGIEEPLPPLPKSKLPLILGGVVVLLAIAVGVVVLRPEPKPVVVEKAVVVEKPVEKPVVVATEKPVVADKIKLNFTSTPDKVDVSEGDILLGVTPLSLQRAPAVITELTFSAKGYKSVTRKVRFDSEQTIPIELEKDKKGGNAPSLTKKPTGLADDPYKQEEDLKESPF
jgi:hypothetical protein